MAKQNVLIVDADPKSLRVLEVSLKKAGYSVTKAVNGKDALEKMEFAEPDLIISDTTMPEMDGFEMCTLLKQNEKWSSIPFIFLTAQKSIEDKIRGLELGVDDYLNKPIFIREILARVNLAIQRRQRERLERRGSKTSFSGELTDMGILDLLQTIDISRKTGVIRIQRDDDEGQITFRDGKVINAATRNRKAADAVYRMLVWNYGHFEIEFKGVEGEETIDLSTQGLLMEGMRRLDEWGRLQEQLPSLDSTFDVDVNVIAERLGEIPDEINGILKHFDGKRTLMEVVDLGNLGDLEALTVITKLYFEGLITEVAGETLGHHSEMADFLSPGSDPGEPPYHSSEPADVVGDDSHGLVPEPDDVGLEEPTSPGGRKMYDTLRMGRADNSLPSGAPAPRLSVAVRGLGFVEALTRDDGSSKSEPKTQPLAPMTLPPRSWDVPGPSFTRRGIDPSRLSDPGPSPIPGFPGSATLEFVRDAAFSAATREPEAAAPVAPLVASPVVVVAPEKERETRSLIPNEAAALSPTEPGPTSPSITVGEALSPPLPSESAEETADRWSRLSHVDSVPADPAERIAAALDAEVPLPAETEPPAPGGSTEYFEGESFAKVVRGRATPPQPIRLGVGSPSEAPPVDPVQRESWEPVSVPMSGAKRAVIAAIVLSVAVLAAVGIWQLYRANTGAAFDDLPVVNKSEPKVDESSNSVPAPRPALKAPEQATQGTAADMASMVKAASSNGEPSTQAQLDSASATDLAPSVMAGDTTQAYAELLAQAERAGRKKQNELLRKAMELHPQGDEAPARLAIALMEGAKTRAEALMLAQQAVGLNPKNAMAWLAIGYIHQLEGRVDESQAAYKRCAEGEGQKLYVNECKKLAR